MLPCPKFFFSFFFFHFDTNEGNFIANKGKYNQPTKNDQGGETPHHKLGVVTTHGYFYFGHTCNTWTFYYFNF
jgi:hypothetical protein